MSALSSTAAPAEMEESIDHVPNGSTQREAVARPQGTYDPLRLDGDGDLAMSEQEVARRPESNTAHSAGSEPQHPAGTSQATLNSSIKTTLTSTRLTAPPYDRSGAEPGKPDRDEAFLKAVASTKRGKKQEDPFDREFNNLRISKPDLQSERASEDWAVLADFGDDSGLRGNFMVVVEMEVSRRQNSRRDAIKTTGSRSDWEGRPDFKKFKKVSRWCFVTANY